MFHSVGDGKGRRRIYVNGNLINHVIWANEEKGLICYMPYPFKVNKKKDRVYTRLLRGNVRVEMINGLDKQTERLH
ncbi:MULTISPECIES: hypothetical protein [Acinetobacter]|uniref:hypothetical protein n=1 Tax=Acinetobacter TaxID=469 RepID=UPI00028DDDCB|nr:MULTISPECIES: hypothetical protein [Acinetobacter]UUG68497.1 hypothetical protein [Acinetobacter phage TCUAN1]EKF47687.1 hypothetical protein W9I_03728 [Acinetobacter nosocomialis Ab22222]PCM90551.1 hypothetical protein CP902_16625 [Acinetobacter baumannii]RDY37980.1 hypothetical protein DX997_16455 [Acinetobacter baumannii]RSB96176.1 hypothetical protein EGS33_19870 [Acinetobacter sp. FDAARGOS_541]